MNGGSDGSKKRKLLAAAPAMSVVALSKLSGSDSEVLEDSKVISKNQNGARIIVKAREDPISEADYIHIRARRARATNSHSLAERARREKISERMRLLKELVPGCNKIAGKAGMLEEIINYVQSLQRQVEFLSMKLATVNPALEDHINIENFHMGHCVPANGPQVALDPTDIMCVGFGVGLDFPASSSEFQPAVVSQMMPDMFMNHPCLNVNGSCSDFQFSCLHSPMEFQSISRE